MAIKERVLSDHFDSIAAPVTALTSDFNANSEEKREEQYLNELEEAVLEMGVLQRLASGKCSGGAERLNRLLLMMIANDHEISARFRSEIEQAFTDKREHCSLKKEKKTERADEDRHHIEELHEMRSIDDDPPPAPVFRSVLQRDAGLFL
jgi:hypothetical protein